MIVTAVLLLIYAALKRRDVKLLAMAFDVSVPPLSLLISILTAGILATGIVAVVGLSPRPLFLIAASLVLAAVSVFLAWIKHGRDILPFRDLVLIVPYLTKKLSLYAALARGRKVLSWIRADRD